MQMRSEPDNQNSVISFVLSKWLLPELSIPAAGQKDRRLWGRECERPGTSDKFRACAGVIQLCSRAHLSSVCLRKVSVGFCRGSRVEVKMSRVEGRG